MSAGANLGRMVTRTAMRWWQARRRRMPEHRPIADPASRRLADAALARADAVSARDQVHRDMLRMMWHFSVDPGQVPPRFRDALRDAEQVCAQCLAVGRCQHWFQGSLRDDAPRSFCPNAELYEDIAVNQRQSSGSDEAPAT